VDGLVVNLANMLTRMIGYSIMEAARIEPSDLRSAGLLGIGPDTVQRLGEETQNLASELSHLF
jgi:hypothetical protein